MKHVIIGTAGHVDHGKTALIRALTGVDTDRLKEEQERGITIDLGFTGFALSQEIQAGIVDVPGHERFINNMLAGVSGMDLVLLVIAADEGICPQTREHMDILMLSGVTRMIVALTKWDKIEQKDRPFVKKRLEQALQDTVAARMPICPVSSVTGEGLNVLKEQMCEMVTAQVLEKDPYAVSRLPIDRFFQLKGVGSVVTGTLMGGTLKKEEEVSLYPSGLRCRIRNIQVHNQDRESCQAGERTAINLTGLKPGQIKRGEVLAATGSLSPSIYADVRLTVLESAQRSIVSGMRFHLFIGTSHVICRILLLEKGELNPGESGLAQIRAESPFVAMQNDRFVLRFFSPVETMAGGLILDAHPAKHAHLTPEQQMRLNQIQNGFFDTLEYYMSSQLIVSAAMAARELGVQKEKMLAEWKQHQMPFFQTDTDAFLCHPDTRQRLEQEVLSVLTAYHEQYPYRLGMNRAELLQKALKGIQPAVAELFLKSMEQALLVQYEYQKAALHGYRVRKDAGYNQVLSTLNNSCRKAGISFLAADQFVFRDVKKDQAKEILTTAAELGKIIVIEEVGGDTRYYTIPAVMEPVERVILSYLQTHEELTIAAVRELTGASRKNGKLIFSYLDAKKITRDTGAQSVRYRNIEVDS